MNHRASLTIGLPAFLLLLGGCIIVDSNPIDQTGGAGGTGNRGDTSSSSSSTSSSSGMGGVGGQGTAGAGVGGGGGSCVKDEDGVLDANACNALNTQATGNVCGQTMDQPPPANGSCTRLVQIVQGGAFDVLATCLKGIAGDATNACDNAQVAGCVDKMYKAACPSADAAVTCQAIADQGCNVGDVFDTQQCLIDLNPLNSTGLNELVACMNKPGTDPNCNVAYDTCFAEVFSY
jgi:hypothetical protein